MKRLQLEDLSKQLGYSKTLISMVLNGVSRLLVKRIEPRKVDGKGDRRKCATAHQEEKQHPQSADMD